MVSLVARWTRNNNLFNALINPELPTAPFIIHMQWCLFKIIYSSSYAVYSNFPYVIIASIRNQLVCLLSEPRCGHPAVPVNARVSLSATTLAPGTIATYVCDEGYETFGETQISCSASGQWMGELPFCGKNFFLLKSKLKFKASAETKPHKSTHLQSLPRLCLWLNLLNALPPIY